jgi:hypothetical protein
MIVEFLPQARSELLHAVAYIVRDPVIWILSIAHGHSLPEYWIDRTV